MPRHWVLDASPLIILGKVGLLEILPRLAANLSVPQGVALEVLAGPAGDPARVLLAEPGNLAVVQVPAIAGKVAAWDLHRGESEALSLALTQPGCEVIVDDRAARNCALALSLAYRGTLGVLLLAHRRGLVPDPARTLQMVRNAGLRIDAAIAEEFLRLAAGEHVSPASDRTTQPAWKSSSSGGARTS